MSRYAAFLRGVSPMNKAYTLAVKPDPRSLMGPHDKRVSRWIEWWNTGDTTIADSIYAPGYTRHSADTPGTGPGPVKKLVAMYRRAFLNDSSVNTR